MIILILIINFNENKFSTLDQRWHFFWISSGFFWDPENFPSRSPGFRNFYFGEKIPSRSLLCLRSGKSRDFFFISGEIFSFVGWAFPTKSYLCRRTALCLFPKIYTSANFQNFLKNTNFVNGSKGLGLERQFPSCTWYYRSYYTSSGKLF